MKRVYSAFFIIFFTSICDAQTENIYGVWENPHRKVEIQEDNLKISLRSFYGRFEEPPIELKCKLSSANSSEEIEIFYANEKQSHVVPVAVSNENIFLNFCVKGSAFAPSDSPQKTVLGFWRPASNAQEIGIVKKSPRKELTGFYFSEDEIFLIRYWLADVEYESVQASFQIDDRIIPVDKFLEIAGSVYTCVQGKGVQIRNVKKSKCKIDGELLQVLDSDKFSDLYLASDFSFLAVEKPYLSRKK